MHFTKLNQDQAINLAIYMTGTKDSANGNQGILALADWLVKQQFIPMPIEPSYLLIGESTECLPLSWLTALHDMGVEFVHALEEEEGLIPSHTTFIYGVSEPESVSHNPPRIELIPYEEKTHASLPKIYCAEATNHLVNHYFQALQSLNREQLAEYFRLLAFNYSDLEIVCDEERFLLKIAQDNGGVIFDLESGLVKANIDRWAMAHVSISGIKIPTREVLATLALQIVAQGESGLGTNGILNALPNLWKRDPQYGLNIRNLKEDPTRVWMDNSVLPLNYSVEGEVSPVFPWALVENTKFRTDMLHLMAETGKAFITDKYAMKDVGDEVAANAAGQGRRGNEMLTIQDASKAKKFLNRATQSRRFLKGEVSGRELSPFKTQLPDGSVVQQGGVRLRTAVVKSVLNFGSGPAPIRPDLELPCKVLKGGAEGKIEFARLHKRVREILTQRGIELGLDGGGKNPGMEYLREQVRNLCEEIVENGEVIQPGQPILTIKTEGSSQGAKLSVVGNDALNQPVRPIGFDISEDLTDETKYSPDWIKVSFDVELDVASSFWKLRNDFVKLTTLPYDIEWADVDGVEIPDWGGVDIALGLECAKGRSLEVALFTIAMGGGTYLPNEGRLVLDHPEHALDYLSEQEIEQGYITLTGNADNSLDDSHINAVHRWVLENKETRHITLDMAKAEWEYFKQIEDRSYLEVVDHGSYVTITEEVECLLGDYFYDVEISTPRENTGRSALTAQQLCSLAMVYPNIAEKMYAEAKEQRVTTWSVVKMLIKHNLDSTPKLNLTNETDRIELAESLGDLNGVNDRMLLEKLYQLYPLGLCVQTSGTNTQPVESLLHFNVLQSKSAFVGKSAEGIAGAYTALLYYAAICEGEESVDGVIHAKHLQAHAGFEGWAASAIESNKLFKPMSQTARVFVNGKIRTTYNPVLNHVEGELPRVLLHPNCAIVKELCKNPEGTLNERYLKEVTVELGENPKTQKVFDFNLLHGEVVALERIPMGMPVCFQVVLDPLFGEIGHAQVLPYLWSAANEGDSDGDGFSLINMSRYGLTASAALEGNENVMSMRGYSFVYGNNPADHPYKDFCSLAEVKKKSFDNLVPYTTRIPIGKYLESAERINQHYRAPVGISYGVASVLVFQAAHRLYAAGEMDKDYQKLRAGNAVAWRLLYEGLGLAGWTENAERFFEYLYAGTFSSEVGFDAEGHVVPHYRLEEGEETHDPLPHLIELSGFKYEHENPSTANAVKRLVMRKVLAANLIRLHYGALKRGTGLRKRMTQVEVENAAIWGALREATRGTDDAGLAEIEFLSDEINAGDPEAVPPESLHNIVVRGKLWERVKCPWLADMLRQSSSMQVLLTQFKWQEIQRADMDYDF